jgi:hypothetical protein
LEEEVGWILGVRLGQGVTEGEKRDETKNMVMIMRLINLKKRRWND